MHVLSTTLVFEAGIACCMRVCTRGTVCGWLAGFLSGARAAAPELMLASAGGIGDWWWRTAGRAWCALKEVIALLFTGHVSAQASFWGFNVCLVCIMMGFR